MRSLRNTLPTSQKDSPSSSLISVHKAQADRPEAKPQAIGR